MGLDINGLSAGGITNAAMALSSIVDQKRGGNAMQDAVEDRIGAALGDGFVGNIARTSLALKRLTGTNIGANTKEQAQGLGINEGARKLSNAAATALNFIPGGFIAGALTPRFKGTQTNLTDEALAMSGTAGTLSERQLVNSYRNQKTFFNNRLEKMANLVDRKGAAMNDIAEMGTNINLNDSATRLGTARNMQLMGIDYIPQNKQGCRLPSIEMVRQILAKKHEDTQFLQAGGVIGVDASILPEGALHKELNHMEDVNPEVDEVITDKGIPIVAVDENGELEQICEIEREELILTKTLTDKIEELRNKGDEDAMIEAGKLLAEELITNTQDNTKQLEDIQNGDMEGQN